MKKLILFLALLILAPIQAQNQDPTRITGNIIGVPKPENNPTFLVGLLRDNLYYNISKSAFLDTLFSENGLQLGVSGTPMDLGTSLTTRAVDIYTTSASVNTGTSVRPFYFKSTMTGVGGVGGRAEFVMTTNVKLGGWSNALKGMVEYGAAGSTTGLGSAIVGELSFGVACTTGTYAPLESELVTNTTAPVSSTSTSFLYMNIDGTDATGITNLNTYGYFFEIGAGITDQAGGIFEAEAQADIDATHVLKCKIDGVTYYIPLNTAKTF